ncbi:hypothetical protein B5S29_g4058 [[Candida] boidinii]|nr:hypothetical protein B5S29_g4058 [[Candida] boidinii]
MSSLTDLLSQLQVHSNSDAHKEVYDCSLKILKKDSSNVAALKKSLIALINLDKYTTAYSLLQKYTSLLSSDDVLLESAYVYYKLENTEELEKLASINKENRGLKHILAQHYYRIGKSIESLKLYQELLSQSTVEDVDLSVNERAVIFQANFFNQSTEILKPSSPANSNSYDQAFNTSFVQIAEKKYDSALTSLKTAISMCEAVTNDLSAQEQESELLPIKIQLAYVYEKLNQFEKSKEILDSIKSNNKSIDKVSQLIITNNLISLSKTASSENPNLLYRALGFPNSLSVLNERLTLPQLQMLYRNESVIGYKSGKNVSKSIKSFSKKFGISYLPLALISANKAGFAYENDFDINTRLLFKYSIKNPQDIPINLLAAQFSIQDGNLQNATSLLENCINSDSANLTNFAIISILLALYESLDRKNSTIQILDKIYEELVMKDITGVEDAKFFMSIAFGFVSFAPEKSKSLFEKIYNYDSTNELVSVVLGKKSTEDLDDISDLIQDIDSEELIKAGIAPLLSSGAASKSKFSSKSKITKKRRVRKNPKHPVKEIKSEIDAERWLPLKDRSYYKPKKGKKNNKDTQGGTTSKTTEESLNISNTPSSTPSSSNTSSSKNKKKNKKKGGR